MKTYFLIFYIILPKIKINIFENLFIIDKI